MQGIYRDGLSELRRRAQASALERGAAIHEGLRRELPRKLRQELTALERQLGETVENLDDVALLEQRTEAYRQALAAAESIAAVLPLYLAKRRWRRAGGVLLLALAVGPLVGLFWMAMADISRHCGGEGWPPSANAWALFSNAAPSCIYTDVSQCAIPCLENGRCEMREGACVAVTRAHCEGSVDCRDDGKCSPYENRCVAASDEDCTGSILCQRTGRCAILLALPGDYPYVPYGGCVARSHEDCAASDECASDGYCVAFAGSCGARRERDCVYQDACALQGRCTRTASLGCVAATDEDCRFSEGCMVEGRCMAKGGRCVASSGEASEISSVYVFSKNGSTVG